MRVSKNISNSIEIDEKLINYSYRLIVKNFHKGQAYGIEVERQDIEHGDLINIERESVELISSNKEKVEALLDLLAKNQVSPIHLIDIIGEYADLYAEDFNDEDTILN